MRKQAAWAAGVATANITPPVGIEMSGFAGRAPSVGVGDELYATALVVRDGTTRAAIVALDLLYVDAAFVEQVCAEVARRTRIPAGNVLLCCTHTHYGPVTGAFEADAVGSDGHAYMADLKFKLAGVVQEAKANLRTAVARIGYAASDIGINRRERKADGGIVLGQNPRGAVDREVVVLRVDRPKGAPVACLVNFACHAVSQSGRGRMISADFPGVACDVVEELTGSACLYLQGACGNINPVIMELGAESPRRLGTMLGAQAVQAYEAAAPIEAAPVRVASRRVRLPAKTFASVKEAEQTVSSLAEELERLRAGRAPKSSLYWVNTRLERARASLENLKAGKPQPPVVAAMWALRLGELGLATAPGEIFCEIGQAVKQASPFRHTMFVGYTNGSIGYVPVAEAYPEGGYEVTHASRVGPGAAGMVTDTALALLRRVKGAKGQS